MIGILEKNRVVSSLQGKIIGAYGLSNGIDAKNGYNGTVGSAITYSSFVNGNGANFNNTTNSFISIPDNNNFSFTNGGGADNPFSISFFVKFNNTTDQWIINKRGNTTSTDEYQILYTGSKIRFALLGGGEYIIRELTTILVVNTTYHICFTYSGSESVNGIKGYVNGVLSANNDIISGGYAGMPNGTSPVIIGRQGWSDGGRLNGQLDELYIFNSALTQSEVTQLQTNYYPF